MSFLHLWLSIHSASPDGNAANSPIKASPPELYHQCLTSGRAEQFCIIVVTRQKITKMRQQQDGCNALTAVQQSGIFQFDSKGFDRAIAELVANWCPFEESDVATKTQRVKTVKVYSVACDPYREPMKKKIKKKRPACFKKELFTLDTSVDETIINSSQRNENAISYKDLGPIPIKFDDDDEQS